MVGVGGQGIILVSDILAEGLLLSGYDVKMSELHGLAQRGGSVTTQITFGDKIHSPVIGTAEADLLVAFEKLEAIRYLRYLKPDGILIANDYEIFPLPVLIGAERYPDQVAESLRRSVKNAVIFSAFRIAEQLAEPRAQNIVLLGAVIKVLGLEKMDWSPIIKRFIPAGLYDLNIRALQEGIDCPGFKETLWDSRL